MKIMQRCMRTCKIMQIQNDMLVFVPRNLMCLMEFLQLHLIKEAGSLIRLVYHRLCQFG